MKLSYFKLFYYKKGGGGPASSPLGYIEKGKSNLAGLDICRSS